MPTYEYKCTSCAESFEVFQNITDEPLKSCPKCNSSLKRLIGKGAGIIFKGSGFYATDYRKEPKKGKPDSSPAVSCPKAKEGCRGCS